jgi:hypothetical protein
VSRGDLASEQADSAAAYNRQPYLLRFLAPHVFPPEFLEHLGKKLNRNSRESQLVIKDAPRAGEQ